MSSLIETRTARRENELIHRSRLVVVALARLFAAGVVVQVFLVGLSVFDSPANWEDHAAFDHWLGLIPLPLILAALVGRLPLSLVVMAGALLVLYGVQYLLVHLDEGYLAALHPVNTFAVLGLSVRLGERTRGLLTHST